MRGLDAEDGEEQAGIVLDPADGGGDFPVSGVADEPDGEITEGRHDAGSGAGSHPGGILTESDITDPVDLVVG